MTPRLSSSRRMTRRSVITDLGAGGIGIILLGACAGSSDSGAASTDAGTTSSTGSTPPGGSAAGSTTDPEETNGSGGTTSDQDPEANPAGRLQLQHVSLGFVSAYVLVRGNEVAIVDTGTSGSRDAILAGLDAMSVTPAMVGHIVLTHNHGDHAGGLAGLEGDLSNATVYAGAADIGSIRSSLTLTEVDDGDEVFGMGIIGTPGHTPGSISLFDTATGILVAGDAINGDGQGGLTGANPDFTPDMATANTSVATLAALMPSVAAFGHGGPPVTDDVAAKLAALV
ncbi:MAG: MBL fold metallo-hydrolase [Ilumatobacter sp.]|uniref:MBL fold metallo-hydrolase n=1 Tax=Ilumatobacter sp. TaxID=1967498 RepID=UPI0032999426